MTTTSADLTIPRCVVCSNVCVLRCAFCGDGPNFCSYAHYEEHWPVHSAVCGGPRPNRVQSSITIAASRLPSTCLFPQLAETSQYVVTALVLMANSARTEFRPVNCQTVYFGAENEPPNPIPDLASFFPYGRGAHVLHYSAAMSILSKPYHIFYCAQAFSQQSTPNQAIKAIVADVPSFDGTLWPGSVVVLKFTDTSCTAYENMGEDDIQNVRVHFALFGRHSRRTST